ncbi:MAG: DUF1320 family protein [Lentisphaeria bacterium]|nr:DUF1320 family protein [Lentisphaeria bacterium]
MSRYAAIADLQLRLSDLYGNLYRKLDGTAMTEEAQADLDAAEAEIDGLIGTRYAVPVESGAALPLLKAWTVTLAEELAWSRSGKSELPKNVTQRAETVRKNLTLIASGKMLLQAAAQDENSGGGSVVGIAGNTPVFGRDKMTGY